MFKQKLWMSTRMVVMFGLAFVLAGPVEADTIFLKNGRKVQAKILEKTDKFTKVDVAGVTITYYAEEIERIEASQVTSVEMPAIKVPENKNAAPALTPKPASTKVSEAKPVAAPQPEEKKALPQPAVVPVAPLAVPTQVTPFSAEVASGTKKQLILNLIEAMGTKESMRLLFERIIAESDPKEAPQLKTALNLDIIIDKLVPVYDKYLTEEEIKVLLSFYQSQVGKKLIAVTPALMEESMAANMAYLQEVLPKETKDASAVK